MVVLPPHRKLLDKAKLQIPGGTFARPVAALFVRTGGHYYNLPGVDPWDEDRDARQYRGPHPVVCHSPCQRWGKMYSGQPFAMSKGKAAEFLGDDLGCMNHALWCVRTFGGVWEHPWGSWAPEWYGLVRPPREGGWVKADDWGGLICCVEQRGYGHYAGKPTLLYYVGNAAPPELKWGITEAVYDQKIVEKHGLEYAKRLGEVGAKGGGKDSPARIDTPPAFRDMLIAMARNVGASITPINRRKKCVRKRKRLKKVASDV